MEIEDLLVSSASAAIALQNDAGAFPAGHNGPWYVDETSARNTAHWTVTCSKAYELTGEVRFKKSVQKAADYLLSKDVRPFGYSCHIMKKKGWITNGLVGQTWIMEGLLAAYKTLGEDRFLLAAHDLVSQHHMEERLRLWHMTSLEGVKLAAHSTLNQQICFSAIALEVAHQMNSRELAQKIRKAIDNLPFAFKFNGKYLHMRIDPKIYLKHNLRQFLRLSWSNSRHWKKFDMLSKGYLSYTLFVLSNIYERAPDLKLWDNEKLRTQVRLCIDYMDKNIYQYTLSDNPMVFAYHPTGFQMPYVLRMLGHMAKGTKNSDEDWINKQIRSHYDFSSNLMTKNTCDPNTLSARLYELTNFLN
jgi:hypothetical protein